MWVIRPGPAMVGQVDGGCARRSAMLGDIFQPRPRSRPAAAPVPSVARPPCPGAPVGFSGLIERVSTRRRRRARSGSGIRDSSPRDPRTVGRQYPAASTAVNAGTRLDSMRRLRRKGSAMDLNELKNRAKDLLADLTEPRPEQDDRAARRIDDDPAARTDPSGPIRTAAPGRARPGRRTTGRAATTDEPASAAVAGRTGSIPSRACGPVRAERVDAAAEPPGPDTGARQRHRPLARSRSPDHGQPVARSRARGSVPPRDLAGRAGSTRRPAAADDPGRPRPAAAASPDVERRSAPLPRRGRHGATGCTDECRERLVTAERADSYSARWDEVKGEFVDEPRQAVVKADALVGELLDELGRLFDQQRRGIEQGLDRRRRVHRGAAASRCVATAASSTGCCRSDRGVRTPREVLPAPTSYRRERRAGRYRAVGRHDRSRVERM